MMHAWILLLLWTPETQAKPLRIWESIPPIARHCSTGTAAVRNNKDNVEYAACYAHLQCEDGTDYGTRACVCPKAKMPVLNQDEQVVGCSGEPAKPKSSQ
jgi:hypothetical protein